ncbi:MAG: AbrB/MazE/SpoVT family DNA-binding domain-containing protein [Rubrobacteraceae bacterium]
MIQVGASVMVAIPSGMLKELGLKVGQEVLLTSEEDTIRVESSIPQPSPAAVEFAARFTKKYEQAMRNLSQQ